MTYVDAGEGQSDTDAAVGVRLVSPEDVDELTALLVAQWSFLEPWEPVRDPEWFTVEGQQARVALALRDHEAGLSVPWVVTRGADIVGQVTLSGIVRGPFQSANLGYWVAAELNGRGVATAAVRRVLGIVFNELGLHRVQAGTLLHNHGSRRVLAKTGFTEIGVAPAYLCIQGRWQDHLLHQCLAPDGA